MAFDAYLKLDGVTGEATRKGFEKQIEIHSFSWGASNPVTVGTGSGGMAGGKVSVSSFNIMKKTDSTSPLLFQACCNGTHYATGAVSLNKSGGKESVDYLKYEFEELMVESIQWSGSSGGDDTPTESLSMAFGKVNMTYTPQTQTGTPGTPVVSSWDVRTNVA